MTYAPGARTLPDPFVEPKTAAWAAGRPEKTIWRWKDRGIVACACRVKDKRIVVRLEDAVVASKTSEFRFATSERPARRRRVALTA